MNEEVFLVFALFGLVLAGVAVVFFRSLETALAWDRFRPSTLVWTSTLSFIAMGFINISDSMFVLGTWLLISGAFVVQVFLHSNEIQRNRHVLWAILLVTPGGWILYFMRFPHFHGLDAGMARMSFDPTER